MYHVLGSELGNEGCFKCVYRLVGESMILSCFES